jgi:hypothetical protein
MPTLSKAAKRLAVEKQKQTIAQRLIPRLARFLGNESSYGKVKVRKILQKGGYKGPGWKDEGRAVQIFTEAGYDMSGFETRKPLRKPPHRAGTASIPQLMPSTGPTIPAISDAAERLRLVTTHLRESRKALFCGDEDGMAAYMLLALSQARK